MSYSRWSESRWYSFWCASDGAHAKETEVFEICSVARFTYRQLKEDMESCLEKVRKLDSEASDEEIDELEVYMKLFLKDIDRYYERLK